ncbi:hypothetical protein [Polynucleobacter necessarius]|uniref:hypothetical protein n=1 Tax=Polynucleobacter necessarius TaxID=576610 RepID=UPI0018D538BC|nr:hypothetical protein [Polynucleobacter necessarius]
MTTKIPPTKEVLFYKRIYYWILIWLHVFKGAIILLLIFPSAKTAEKNVYIQKWSQQLLNIFGVELKVIDSQALPAGTYLLSSNHISWMDIHAINGYSCHQCI